MNTNYVARSNYLADLPLTALLDLAPIFLAASFLAAGFLAKDALFVADFFAAKAFLAGAFLTDFLAIFLGALVPTFPDSNFCCAFSFLAAALWATVLRPFSSAESLKQPEKG